MSKPFVVWLPYLPPSSNKIYIRHPKGMGKILSGNARKFKIDAMRAIQSAGHVALMTFKNNVPYELRLSIFLDAVENKSSKSGERFKQIDLSNRVKLVEDTIAEATGIDDRHNFRIVLEKHCDPNNPGIYISLTPLDEGEVGLTKDRYESREYKRNGASGPVPESKHLLSPSRTGTGNTGDVVEGGDGPSEHPSRPRRRRT